jgi:DNA-binding transcriptional regulator YiaG
MTGKQCREIRKKLNMTQESFAKLLGVKRSFQISRWETGYIPIPDKRAEAIDHLGRNAKAVQDLLRISEKGK